MDIDNIKRSIQSLETTKFGYSIHELRKLSKKGAKLGYIELINQLKTDDFWLKMYFAFLIGYLKTDIKTSLKYFEDFIPFVDDWAVNDSLCQNFTIARKFQNEVWTMLMKYKNSKKEFEVRIVSVMLLSHFLNDEYIDRVIEVLNGLHTDSYYSRMGLAWAVATITGKYPEKGIKFLKSQKCKLDNWTYNKSLQKIRESYRVPDSIKKFTKTLKR